MMAFSSLGKALMNTKWFHRLVVVAAFAASAAIPSASKADPMPVTVEFSTSGWAGPATSSNASGGPIFNPISFVGVHGSEFIVPSSLGLGSFQSAQLGPNVSANFVNVPFAVMLTMYQQGSSTDYSYVINGRLNGGLAGASQSSIVATFDSIVPNSGTPGSGGTPGLSVVTPLGTLELPPFLALVPSTSGGGLTSLEGIMLPVPEPGSVAIFGMAFAAFGFRKLRRRNPATA